MKNTKRRLLAAALALCLTVGLVPAQAAEGSEAETPQTELTTTETPMEDAAPEDIPTEEPVLDEVLEMPDAAVLATSGTCGAEGNEANVTWTIDTDTNTFTISGTGAMMDYASDSEAPWYSYMYNNSYKGSKYQFAVVIGEGITEIYDLKYIRIRSLSFPSTLKKIGISCFSSQDVVTGYFDIGNGTEYIKNKYPMELELPASLEYVAVRAFGAFENLTKLTIHCPDSAFHDNNDGYGAATFCDNYYLTEVVLPDDWTTIPTWMFAGCTRLTTVNTPSSLTSIGNKAFYKCGSLTSFDLPEGLTKIGSAAFYNCWELDIEHFPDTLKTIGVNSFYHCMKLSHFNWPEAMLDGGSLGESAFDGCSIMTTDTGHLTIPDTVTIGTKAFRDCDGITSVTLPSTTDNIGTWLLEGCSGITSITIPEGWTKVPAYTFEYCDKLASIKFLSNSIEIGERAFASCKALTELTLPVGVTKLGKESFISCENLKTLTIENPDLTYMLSGGSAVFQQCYALEEINLPEGLKEISSSMFARCTSLKGIHLPDSLTTIGNSAFSNCSALTDIVIPDNVTKLYYGEFQNCTSLVSVTLPDTMTYIGFNSFSGCAALESIVIPDSVTQISNNAFYNKYFTTGLTQVRFLGDAPLIKANGYGSSDPAFPDTATLYYTAGKSGWTTPEWNGYPAYPILGEPEYHDSGEVYYAPVSLYHFTFEDNNGAPLTGVTITYQDSPLSSEDSHELAVGMSVAEDETITFTKDGYHAFTLPAQLLHNYNTITLTPTSKTAPFLQTIYSRHKEEETFTDMVHYTANFSGGNTNQATEFYVDANWNGSDEGSIYLSTSLLPQDGWELENGFNEPKYISAYLNPGQDLYLLVVTGTTVQHAVKLNTVITETKLEQDISISEDTGTPTTVAPSGQNNIFDLLAKFQFSYDFFEVLPVKVEVKSDGTVKALIGIKAEDDDLLDKDFETFYGSVRDKLTYTSGDLNDSSKVIDSLRSLLKNRGLGFNTGMASLAVKGEYQVFGYAEGKVTFDPVTHKPGYTFYEAAVGLSLEGKVEEYLQAYVLNAPVYFSGSLGDKATFTIPLETNTDAKASLVPPYHLAKFENELELRLAGGLGWDKIASVGIYGKGTGTLGGYIPFEKEYSSLKFNASFGLEAKVFSIFSQDVPIFQGQDVYVWGAPTTATYAANRLSQGEWLPTSRDYLYAMPDQAVYNAVDVTNTDLTQSLLDEGIYPSSDVQFLTTEKGHQYAVWTDDPGTGVRAEANNRTKLYYTYRYYFSNSDSWGSWNTVRPLMNSYDADDDGTADFSPVLKEVDGTIYVLWQNANRALTADDTVDTLPGTLDISCAYYWDSASSFKLLGTVGTENYDTAADITVIDGVPHIVWASNSANSAFEGAGAYSIHRQALTEDAEIETLVTGLNQVDSITADGSKVWYSTDTDAESDAMADYAVFCYDGETTSQISDEGVAATKPTLVNGEVTWYENGAIRAGDDLITLAADTDRYQYVVSPTGMKAVVYTVDNDVRQTTMYASFDDGTGWGEPITMSGVVGNINSFAAGFDKNGVLNILACERGLDETQANYLSGTANLNLYTVTPYADLAVTNATYLGQSLVKGGTLDLVVDVVNNGMSAASVIQVAAYNGEEALGAAAYAEFLPSGQSGQYYVSVPLDDPSALTDLKVEVTAGGYADKTPDDNIASVILKLSDVSVEGSEVTTYGEDTTVRTLVVNRGQTDLSDLTVSLYAEDGETVLSTQSIAALAVGKGEFISFSVTPGEEDQLLTIQAAAAGLDVKDENLVSNNKVTVLVEGTKPADVPTSVIASAAKNDDGTVSVATYASSPADSVCSFYVAGYDDNGRMVDMAVSDAAFHSATLSGGTITKVRVFGLDADLIPVTDVIEYDLK